MSFSNTFLDIIETIDNSGLESQPRDLKVREVLMANFDIDPTHPIANFKDRKFNWKYFAGELAWYLKRDNDIDYINNFSSFWSRITNPNSNEINSNYGSLVINEEQIGWVVDSLIKDKNTRQAIMFFNQPKFQFEGNKDFVCTMYANFFIRNNRLFMKIQMRSNDIFYGLTFDAPFFAFLHQSIYQIVKRTHQDLELGYYFHHADNLHFYEHHFELADKIKTNGQDDDHSLILKEPLFDYVDNQVVITERGQDLIDKVTASIGQKDYDYKELLSEYFQI